MNQKKLAILRNEVEDDHLNWVEACKKFSDRIQFQVVDLTLSDWMEQITSQSFDGLLALPSGWTTPFKTLYDERVMILHLHQPAQPHDPRRDRHAVGGGDVQHGGEAQRPFQVAVQVHLGKGLVDIQRDRVGQGQGNSSGVSAALAPALL